MTKGHIHKDHLHATEVVPQTLIQPHPVKEWQFLPLSATHCLVME